MRRPAREERLRVFTFESIADEGYNRPVAAPSTMRTHRPAALLWIVVLVVLSVLVHAGVGTIRILPLDVLKEILAGPSDSSR